MSKNQNKMFLMLDANRLQECLNLEVGVVGSFGGSYD